MGTRTIRQAMLLLPLLSTSCWDRPQFVLVLDGLDASYKKLYVSATLTTPGSDGSSGGGPGNASTQTVFDLNGTSGSFDFGLTLDVPSNANEQGRVGVAELMFADDKCIKRIVTVPLSGTKNGALTKYTVNLKPAAGEAPQFEEVPIMPVGSNGSAKSCYPIQRPVITAVTRELNGTWGSAVSRLKIHGWGFVKGTTVSARVASGRPDTVMCGTLGVQCSAWDDTDMSKSISEATTTHITVDLKDFTPKLAPAILTLGKILPPQVSKLGFLTDARPANMATALFPFSVAVTATADGQTKSDTYAEFP